MSRSELTYATEDTLDDIKTLLTDGSVLVPGGMEYQSFTNILKNGNFESWSAGTSSAPDGWSSAGGPTITRDTLHKVDTYSMKLVAGGGAVSVNQTIADHVRYQGRSITLSAWVWCDTSGQVSLQIIDSAGSTYSSTHSGGSAWELLTVTRTIDASASSLTIRVGRVGAGVTAYFDGAICVEGSVCPAFSPKPLVDDGQTIEIDSTTNIATIDTLQVDNDSTFDGDIQGATISQESSFTLASNLLGLMTDPRMLVIMTDDPSGGTLTDYSTKSHDGTINGSMTSGDQLYKGLGYVYDMDGSDDNVNFGDHADFEFDDTGAAPFTIAALVEVVATASNQMLLSKCDIGTALREYTLFLLFNEKFSLQLFDESTNATHWVTSQILSEGYHFVVSTYDGSGGNDADDGMNMYIDGVLDNDAKTGTVATYTAMEPSATAMVLGAKLNSGALNEIWQGNIGTTLLDGSEWSAQKVYQAYLLMKGVYNI